MPKARLVFDGDWVYTEKEARIHKLTQETETKIDNIPGVVDDVHSTSTTDALSANMGKYLQDQIDNMSWTTTFLSTWDCTTWLPETDPSVDPYIYKTWNYYIVSNVADSWWTNYKPHWSTYTHWTPSTAVETEAVEMNDWYIYDGSQWILQPSWGKVIVIDDMLKPDSKNAVENRAVYSALTQKQNNILDLATIREWATAGSTAIQPWDNITELTNNAGYQTAWDVAIAIDEAMWTIVDDVNTKTFYLSSMNDLVHAQEAYDWYQSWKTPIISLTEQWNANKSRTYILKTYLDNNLDYNVLCFVSFYVDQVNQTVINWWSELTFKRLNIKATKQWVVTEIVTYNTGESNPSFWKFLSPWVNYGNAVYTPEYPGSPATKKYVDDTVESATEWSKYVWPTSPSNPTEGMLWYDTTNDILKAYDWTNWKPVDTNTTYSNWTYLTLNGTTFDVDTTSIATKSYVDEEVQNAISSWTTSPSNPVTWQLWYDTTNNVLKIYNGTSWDPVDTNTTYSAGTWLSLNGTTFSVDSSISWMVSDTAYSASWDGDTTHSPSKNAVYDVLWDINTLLANI